MINDIKRHAQEQYPKECCGYVVLRDGVEIYVPCENSSEDPERSFRISGGELIRVTEEFGEPIAVVHSHPDESARPSDGDRKMCEQYGLPFHIISIGKLKPEGFDFSEVFTITPCGWKAPLEGRQFAHGQLDCYSLFQDFYDWELGIKLPNFERKDNWWNTGERLYTKEIFESNGFREVGNEPLQRGDVVVMQILAPVENHTGIYMGDGKMLHHLYGQTSRVVPYDRYKSTIRYVMRYDR
jgi:proteasome lid subunit RPN8/RPN11